MAISARIKSFTIEQIIKNSGIEVQYDDGEDGQLGDLIVSKTGITWCKGKTKKENGIQIKIKELANICENLESIRTHLKQANKKL